MQHPLLFTLDTRGRARFWSIRTEGSSYSVRHGLVGTKGTEMRPVTCKPKNRGRANETTAAEQAEAEAKALWETKKRDGYVETIDDLREVNTPKPMLARPYDKARDKIEQAFAQHHVVYCQPKLDGIRCLAKKNGLFSRTGRRIVSCEHIEADLKPFFQQYPDATLDGELYNHAMREDFNGIVSLVRTENPDVFQATEAKEKIQYHIYDLISDQDFSWRINTAHRAIQLATAKAPNHSLRIVPTKTVGRQGLQSAQRDHIQDGYEGTMIRLPEAGYEAKRSWTLIKCKTFKDAEFSILRVEEGRGAWAGAAKRIVCKTPEGQEFGAGLRGSFDWAQEILARADAFVGGEATIRFQELTPEGIPRFPVATALYEGARAM